MCHFPNTCGPNYLSENVFCFFSWSKPSLSDCSYFQSFLCVFSPDLSPVAEPPPKRAKVAEAFQLSAEQQQLIREDTANKKLWDEAMGNLKEGPVRISADCGSNLSPRCRVHKPSRTAASKSRTRWMSPIHDNEIHPLGRPSFKPSRKRTDCNDLYCQRVSGCVHMIHSSCKTKVNKMVRHCSVSSDF